MALFSKSSRAFEIGKGADNLSQNSRLGNAVTHSDGAAEPVTSPVSCRQRKNGFRDLEAPTHRLVPSSKVTHKARRRFFPEEKSGSEVKASAGKKQQRSWPKLA